MSEQAIPAAELTEDQRRKVEEFVEEEEGAVSRYRGWLAVFLTAVAVASSAFHLYAAYGIVQTDLLRGMHVGIVLFLTYLHVPGREALPPPPDVVGRGARAPLGRLASSTWS